VCDVSLHCATFCQEKVYCNLVNGPNKLVQVNRQVSSYIDEHNESTRKVYKAGAFSRVCDVERE